jgi:predicted transcriptional regulator
MSKNKLDKGKLVNKLHQLQKRLFRMETNEGHSADKLGKRKGMLKKLVDAIRGKGKKPTTLLNDIDFKDEYIG